MNFKVSLTTQFIYYCCPLFTPTFALNYAPLFRELLVSEILLCTSETLLYSGCVPHATTIFLLAGVTYRDSGIFGALNRILKLLFLHSKIYAIWMCMYEYIHFFSTRNDWWRDRIHWLGLVCLMCVPLCLCVCLIPCFSGLYYNWTSGGSLSR
jgi:hypothetical protein